MNRFFSALVFIIVGFFLLPFAVLASEMDEEQ